MKEPRHKFHLGQKIRRKRNNEKGIIQSVSSGWNPPLAYVKFRNATIWLEEKYLTPVVSKHFNPSVR